MKLATKTLLSCLAAVVFVGPAQAAVVTASVFDEESDLVVTGGDVVIAVNYGDTTAGKSAENPVIVNGISHIGFGQDEKNVPVVVGSITHTISGVNNIGDFRNPANVGFSSGTPLYNIFRGITPGVSNTLTIEGLTPGTEYLLQMYWEHTGSGNLFDITVEGDTTTGLAVVDGAGTLLSTIYVAGDDTLDVFMDYQANTNNWISGISLQVVPEPGSLALLGLGGLLIARRRRS